MKCVNCQTKGTHFKEKICPPCTDSGVTKDQVVIEKKQELFIGTDIGTDMDEFIEELKNSKANVSHIRRTVKQDRFGNRSKDEGKVTWHETTIKNTGGTDGSGQIDKSK